MSDLNSIAGLRIRLASPQQIRAWSSGQVTKPDTLNYLTNQPERDGLFCERIFGPMHDYTCACGKYRHERTPGFVCERCGVEVTQSRVRRERMGHIELAVPIAHSWFARGTPNILAILLHLSPRQLASVLAYGGYLVTAIDDCQRQEALLHVRNEADRASLSQLTPGAYLDEERYRSLARSHGNCFRAQTGGEAIRLLLDALDLPALALALRRKIRTDAESSGGVEGSEGAKGSEGVESSGGARGDVGDGGSVGGDGGSVGSVGDVGDDGGSVRGVGGAGGVGGVGNIRQRKIVRRLHVVEAFRASGVDPRWMMMDVIPVLPPDLRPLVHIGGERFATSDLNSLYERVIQRNARVQRFMQQGAPDVIMNAEKRLLQDACDALFDNARGKHPATGSHGSHRRPLKSLTDTLKGKQGRFRRNLLGKRVDYSGRSVICVGLDLHLHECGLPGKIALELFKPFVIHKLLDRHLARTPRHAKRLVERRHACIWDQLAECMHEKVVLLNRAPTLHRLGIQAFEPRLVEGDAILLHPLVCSAFNADFDGDQMAVHLPLSEEAQAEARQLMLSIRNMRSPATGDPTITLSQEIVLGCYYLTEDRPGTPGHVFTDAREARLACDHGLIDLHTHIIVRIPHQQVYDAPPPAPATACRRGRIETTVGRLIFNELLPPHTGYRNYPMTKECLQQLITGSLESSGADATAHLADAIKRLGYHYATRSGTSFGMGDMVEPPEKQMIVARGQARSRDIQALFQEGMITKEERDRQVIALWTGLTEQISARLVQHLDAYGTLSTIIKSGCTKARFQQIRQLSGIRGLMADPSGRIIPIPVLGNYLRGLQIWELFIAASGARKGFMDRSLNTAQSGYLTRKLVEVGMEVWTTMDDCGTQDGWLLTNEESQALGLPDFRNRAIGRVLAEPTAGIAVGTLLDEQQVEHLLASGVHALRVRSPLTCQARYGICCKCYGQDLATGTLVRRGVAVGVIAGQSIGEPGTQLTMRTFHSGGIANAQGDITQGLPRVSQLFEAWVPRNPALLASSAGTVHIDTLMGRTMLIINGSTTHPIKYMVPASQSISVKEGQLVSPGTPLTTGACDPGRLLALQGRETVARYLINEVQQVYRATGVYIHDKHIEVIVRQMLRFVQVSDPGDTALLPGDLTDRFSFIHTNEAIMAQGGEPALCRPVLLGLTRAALSTTSWVSAASFQETSKVLTNAAINGKIDPLRGYKERVVLGARIPTIA